MASQISSRVQSLNSEQLHKIDHHLLALAKVCNDPKSSKDRGGEEGVESHLQAIKLFCDSAIHRK